MDVLKEIYDSVSQRIRSPIYGYVLFAFLVINWKVVYFVVFSGESALMKFRYFDQNTNFVFLYILPFVVGLAAALLAPFVANFGSWWARGQTTARRQREIAAAHELLLQKNKLLAERENQLAIHEQSLIDRAKRDQQVEEIEDDEIRESLKENLEAARKTGSSETAKPTDSRDIPNIELESSSDPDISEFARQLIFQISSDSKGMAELDLSANQPSFFVGDVKKPLDHDLKLELEYTKALKDLAQAEFVEEHPISRTVTRYRMTLRGFEYVDGEIKAQRQSIQN